MIILEGKSVYSDLAEIVEPARTALVLVDMQRDFIEDDGAFGLLGIDRSMYPSMISRLKTLLNGARRASVLIVHIQMTTLPGRLSDSPAQIRFNLRMHENFRQGGTPLTYAIDGTKGHQFIDDFKPQDNELVVRKSRSSGFWGTNLNQLLRSNAIESVIITGVTTEGCVESTARDAMFSDFYVVIPQDCVASDDTAQHEASLLLMRNRFDISDTAELNSIWQKSHGSMIEQTLENH